MAWEEKEETSVRMKVGEGDEALEREVAVLAPWGEMSARKSFQPLEWRWEARAAPMPEAEPVIIATGGEGKGDIFC